MRQPWIWICAFVAGACSVPGDGTNGEVDAAATISESGVSIAADEFFRTTRPVQSTEDRAAAAGWGTGTWRDQHDAINRIGESGPLDLVFLGDSITQSWGGPGRKVGAPASAVWDEFFGAKRAANFGISGDRTQHVLWRIQNGNFDRIAPKLIVLMIGTNNLRHDSPEAIARGTVQVVADLVQKCPTSNVLVCSVLRGKDDTDPLRVKARKLNELVERRIRGISIDDRVHFADLESVFYDEKGVADAKLMRGDFVHFQVAGYRAWAQAVAPLVRELGI